MIRCTLPPAPENRDAQITVSTREWTNSMRKFLTTAIEYSREMNACALNYERKRMRTDLGPDSLGRDKEEED